MRKRASAVKPVLAWVTQGKTDHMVTIVDRDVLAMLEIGGNLSSLPQDSDIFIKWNNTDGKQPVVVSSVRIIDLDNEGRGRLRSGRNRGSTNNDDSDDVDDNDEEYDDDSDYNDVDNNNDNNDDDDDETKVSSCNRSKHRRVPLLPLPLAKANTLKEFKTAAVLVATKKKKTGQLVHGSVIDLTEAKDNGEVIDLTESPNRKLYSEVQHGEGCKNSTGVDRARCVAAGATEGGARKVADKQQQECERKQRQQQIQQQQRVATEKAARVTLAKEEHNRMAAQLEADRLRRATVAAQEEANRKVRRELEARRRADEEREQQLQQRIAQEERAAAIEKLRVHRVAVAKEEMRRRQLQQRIVAFCEKFTLQEEERRQQVMKYQAAEKEKAEKKLLHDTGIVIVEERTSAQVLQQKFDDANANGNIIDVG